jgi:hypothetical protein
MTVGWSVFCSISLACMMGLLPAKVVWTGFLHHVVLFFPFV